MHRYIIKYLQHGIAEKECQQPMLPALSLLLDGDPLRCRSWNSQVEPFTGTCQCIASPFHLEWRSSFPFQQCLNRSYSKLTISSSPGEPAAWCFQSLPPPPTLSVAFGKDDKYQFMRKCTWFTLDRLRRGYAEFPSRHTKHKASQQHFCLKGNWSGSWQNTPH